MWNDLLPFPSRNSLGRSFAACLGCIALSVSILLGLIDQGATDAILSYSLNATAVFTAVGWILGNAADSIVRNSVEMNYRARVEQLRAKQRENQGAAESTTT